MAKTITQLVIKSVRDCSPSWVSSGELYQQVRLRGYQGPQEKVIAVAERLAHKGTLDSSERGRSLTSEYRLLEASL